jgi:hypothetical protein
VASSFAEDDVMIEEQLRERLRKVEALYLGAATAGERMRRKPRRSLPYRQAGGDKVQLSGPMEMPAIPGARFAMIEPKIGFRPLEAFFDGPAQARNGCKFGQRRAGGNEAKVISPLGGSPPAAADEKKAFEARITRPGQSDAAQS